MPQLRVRFNVKTVSSALVKSGHFASEKAFKAWRDLTMREEVTTIAADTSLEDPIVTLDVGGGGGGGKSDRRPAKRARG